MKSRSLFLPVLISILPAIGAKASLTSVYQFNETSGNSAADTIRGPAGAGGLNNFGGSQWVAGKIGNALEFDGADDFVLALNAVPTGTTAFSVSAWVWADAAPIWGSIVKNWGGASAGSFHLGFNVSSGQISNYLNAPTDGPVLAPSVLSLNAWHHIAVTYNGGSATQSLYIDGTLAASRLTAPADLDALTPNMGIGVKTDNSTLAPDPGAPGYWDGKLDDLAFWNETLSAAQIATIKTNGDNGIGVVPEPASAAFLLFAAALMRRRR